LYVWDTTAATHYMGPAPWDDPVEYWQSKGYKARQSHWYSHVQLLVEWTQSDKLVAENHQLVSRANTLAGDITQAEADCVNALNKLLQYSCAPDVIPVTGLQLDAWMAQGNQAPWGGEPDATHNALESIGLATQDFVVGFVKSVGALLGFDPTSGDWSLLTAGRSWAGLGKIGGALVVEVVGTPVAMACVIVPGPVGDVYAWAVNTTTPVEDAIINKDMWGKDPVRAATTTLLNIGTFFLPGAGEIAGGVKTSLEVVSATTKIARVGQIAETGASIAGKVEDVLALPGRLAGDAITRLTNRFPDLRLPKTSPAITDETHLAVKPGHTTQTDLDLTSQPGTTRGPHNTQPGSSVSRDMGAANPEDGMLTAARRDADHPQAGRETSPDEAGAGSPAGRPAGDEHPTTGHDGSSREAGTTDHGVDGHDSAPIGDHATNDPGSAVPVPGDTPEPVLGSAGHVAADDPALYPRPSVTDPTHIHHVQADDLPVNEAFATRTNLDANAVYHVEGRGDFYTNADGKVTYVKTTWADDPKLPNPDLMDPQPGTTYVVTPRIKDPVEGLNYDQVLVVSDDKLTVTFYAEHLAPGDAVRNDRVQSLAGGADRDYEGGHLGSAEDGGGYEFINYTQQHWLANRGSGPLSFKNQDAFFKELTSNDPTAVEHVTITVTYPDGAVPTPTTYTPRGGDTYTGTINPKPESYKIQWTEHGVDRDLPTIPNDEAGWKQATQDLKTSRGEQ